MQAQNESDTMKTFAELEAEKPQDFRNPKRTLKEWEELEKFNKTKREIEAKTTKIETDKEREDLEEYPEQD